MALSLILDTAKSYWEANCTLKIIQPAFKLTGLSRFILQFQNGLSATFVKNSALQNFGGVIYAHNELSSDNCMFTSNSSNSKISMLFKENTAGNTANAIFSSNLLYCKGIA